jgi:hypothetical protein
MYAVEIAKKVFEKCPCITNESTMLTVGTRKVIRNLGESVILDEAWKIIAAESVTKANNLVNGFGANADFPSDLVSSYRYMQKELMEEMGEA